MEDIIIRQRREVTAMGITQVRELWAQGYIDQSGVFRLKRCVAPIWAGKAVKNGKPCCHKPCRVGTQNRGGLCWARFPSG